MKTMKFFTYALFVTFLSLAACSPEDGEDGADGIDGATGTTGQDGADGTNGTDGQDGTDGNANVSTFIFDASDFEGTGDTVTMGEVTQDVLDNDVVLTYLSSLNTLNEVVTSIQVPGTFRDDFTNDLFIAGVELFPGDVFSGNLSFSYVLLSSGNVHPVQAGQFSELKVIIIESSSTTGRSAGITKESINAELAAAGVDINNYDDVLEYLEATK